MEGSTVGGCVTINETIQSLIRILNRLRYITDAQDGEDLFVIDQVDYETLRVGAFAGEVAESYTTVELQTTSYLHCLMFHFPPLGTIHIAIGNGALNFRIVGSFYTH